MIGATRSCGEDGSIAVELVASVPILVVLTMGMVQGLYAVTAVEAASRAARDAARAASPASATTPYSAAQSALPGWVRVRQVSVGSGGGCAGECSTVQVEVPFGVPGVLTAGSFTVTKHADLPRVDAWG
ncbi:TadE/TadG family type IV pilus assembly protein [Angustibacter sp. McL0619]|uniref:TadE/TadG family type IV pilus assembly protein n=1 Tax=Angustibacter sp. McL0619 TaxID=3415676 RepID=UPI003CFA9E44